MNGIVIVRCGASFRSGSPHIFSVTLLHLTLITSLMWLKPINTTARGQMPRDKRGPLFLTTGSMQWKKAKQALLPSRTSYQLDLSNTYTQRQTELQSVGILWDL